jgi:hypothetical protein
MNIGKANAPQGLPISASIHLNQLPDDAQALEAVCLMLEKQSMLDNAVGLTTQTLYLTSHVGTADARKALADAGFTLDKQFIYVHNLTRHHDTSALTGVSLCGDILHMKQNASNAILSYDTQTDMEGFDTYMLRGDMVQNLMRLLSPGHMRALNLMLPMTSALIQLSFDDIMLGGFAKHRNVHQKTLDFYLRQEISLLSSAVQALFPDIHPAFTTWSNSYLIYLREQAAQKTVTDAVIEKVTTALEQARAKSATKAATPDPLAAAAAADPASPSPTIKDRMRAVTEEAGLPTMDGPLTAKPLANEMVDHPTRERAAVKDVHFKNHFIHQAWRVPAVANLDAVLHVPAWALADGNWELISDAGHWLVRTPQGVQVFTDEQFLYYFEVIQ